MSLEPTRSAPVILVEISAGELFDKIGILQIKRARLRSPAALANVEREYAALTAARDRELCPPHGRTAELEAAIGELQTVNERLWEIEDAIRLCERDREFGSHFVDLARSVYRENDRRAALKRHINELVGSRLTEEKSYVSYS